MDSFEGKIAVVTGGGSGMGRELVRQLAADGCHVAMCDVSGRDWPTHERPRARRAPPGGRVVTTAVADVADRAASMAFRDAVAEEHATDHVDLLFNNAGIGGGGSFVLDGEDEWDKTFAVCWGGVYHCTRAFLPLLLASDGGPRREHEQRQRVLGVARSRLPPHRVQRGEVRGEGFQRSAHHRLPHQRAAPARLRRHARPHRHERRVQLVPCARARPEGR